MKIAIIGTGAVGSVLGSRWAQNGHQVVFGSRTPTSERVQSLLTTSGPNATATTPFDAITEADVVVLAVKDYVAVEMIEQLGNLDGKIIIDPNNPLKKDLSGLTIGTTTSLGEEIAAITPNAHVVKAFNMTGAKGNMANPIYGDQKLSMWICGDDDNAKKIVSGLAEELDFGVVDCGPMTSARYLEPMAILWITLAIRMGGNIGFRLLEK